MRIFSISLLQKLLFGLILGMSLCCTSLLSQTSIGYLSSRGQHEQLLSFSTQTKPEPRTYWKSGALIGFGVGVTGSAIAVYQGGSTSLCDQSKNQDATSTGACLSIIGGSGLVLGGIGALIGSLIKKSFSEELSERIGLQIMEGLAYGHMISIQWTF